MTSLKRLYFDLFHKHELTWDRNIEPAGLICQHSNCSYYLEITDDWPLPKDVLGLTPLGRTIAWVRNLPIIKQLTLPRS